MTAATVRSFIDTDVLVYAALGLHQAHRLSFWDALIVQAAHQSGCVQLLTEDMTAGAIVSGVRLVNPFA